MEGSKNNQQEHNISIAVLGAGYVGLVTATCFAEAGYRVICVDIDPQKIINLNKYNISIYEPQLKELIIHNHQAKRLQFTIDHKYAIENSKLIFISVGTPQTLDGHIDLQCIEHIARTIGNFLNDEKIIISKSTIPVGTTYKIKDIILNRLEERGLKDLSVHVAANPEFIKEGSAVDDFCNPDRVIIGADSDIVQNVMQTLYSPFIKKEKQLLFMDVCAAEFTKYVANAMLATKISFINEIANIANRLNVNIKDVYKGISLDPRIGMHFLNPGCGYGGSCLPKDLRGLIRLSEKVNYQANLLEAVELVNAQQQNLLFVKLQQYFNDNLNDKRIAIWGLAFKPNTNDIRDASSCKLIESLLERKVNIQAFDPKAMDNIAKIYGNNSSLTLCTTKEDCLKDANALVICTEWEEFVDIDIAIFTRYMKQKVIFDGRNLLDYKFLKKHGVEYYGVGYGETLYPKNLNLCMSEV